MMIMLQGEARALTNYAKNQFCNGEVFPILALYTPSVVVNVQIAYAYIE